MDDKINILGKRSFVQKMMKFMDKSSICASCFKKLLKAQNSRLFNSNIKSLKASPQGFKKILVPLF